MFAMRSLQRARREGRNEWKESDRLTCSRQQPDAFFVTLREVYSVGYLKHCSAWPSDTGIAKIFWVTVQSVFRSLSNVKCLTSCHVVKCVLSPIALRLQKC